MYINKNFELTKEQVFQFQQQGYIVIKNLFTEKFVSEALLLAKGELKEPQTNYGKTFNRLKYDVGNNEEIILSLMQNEIFSNTLKKLTEKKLLFTQGLSFELKKNKDKGFPWHVGTVSFGCQREEDMGYTLWIPFCKINSAKQAGGMKLVPTKVFSGRFIFQYINLLPKFINKKLENKDNIDFEYFYHLKNDILNLPAISELLDYYAEEPNLNIGDAIFFNKYVLHRSVPLKEGTIDSRIALALRFVELESKYDKARAENQEYPKKIFNYSGSSNFNIEVCKTDNQLLSTSPIFKNTLSKRIIG